ncbi:MAG: DUF3343 domain-containing protein [Clostridia bacterium]|nr:DUF3343 domain-containing protein [Clostridia bacterium]
MTEILAVFRSRTQAADCKAKLAARGVKGVLVATPAEIKTGCGLSVKISAYDYNIALKVILGAEYAAFTGFARRGKSGRYYINMG